MEEESVDLAADAGVNDEASVVKAEREVSQLVPTLAPIMDEAPSHKTVFVNELKLSDFKLILAKHGIVSEFSGGVLWCANGTVALKRQDTGRLTVEGCLCDEYYTIRNLLYEQYAIL